MPDRPKGGGLVYEGPMDPEVGLRGWSGRRIEILAREPGEHRRPAALEQAEASLSIPRRVLGGAVGRAVILVAVIVVRVLVALAGIVVVVHDPDDVGPRRFELGPA